MTSITLWIVAAVLVAAHVALCIRDAKTRARNRRAYHDALMLYIKRWREGWRKGVWDGTGDTGADNDPPTEAPASGPMRRRRA